MRLKAGADLDYVGEIRFGSGVEAAYFAQDTADLMDGEASVEEEAESLCPTELLPKIRNLLGAFLFRGDDIHKSVRMLSGGERSRLALLKMLLKPANLLVLDEPTNHLDLTSKDVLLEALRAFEGTVLFVSHDRFFIEELADRVLELEAGSAPRWYVGDYRYFLEKKAAIAAENAAASDLGRADSTGSSARSSSARGNQGNASHAAAAFFASSYEEDKARKARVRKLQKREEEILARIETIGAQKAAAEREMGLPGNYSDGAKMKRLAQAVEQLESETLALNAEWESIAEELAGV
jgi:ATP-binding cassette subfamily F protein 3